MVEAQNSFLEQSMEEADSSVTSDAKSRILMKLSHFVIVEMPENMFLHFLGDFIRSQEQPQGLS
jgi:hypothetical protein